MPATDMAAYMRNRRAKRRAQLIDMMGGKCARCGSTEDLEFNHLDRFQKSFTLSGAGLDKAWEKILTEVEKCEMVCHEHHLEYTAGQWERQELRPWNDNTEEPYVHGTARTYSETKCKCPPCRAAKRLYREHLIAYGEKVE